MRVERVSQISGKVNVMDLDITAEQIADYESGTLIQNAFPNLTPAEREFFKTGITEAEWENMFG